MLGAATPLARIVVPAPDEAAGTVSVPLIPFTVGSGTGVGAVPAVTVTKPPTTDVGDIVTAKPYCRDANVKGTATLNVTVVPETVPGSAPPKKPGLFVAGNESNVLMKKICPAAGAEARVSVNTAGVLNPTDAVGVNPTL